MEAGVTLLIWIKGRTLFTYVDNDLGVKQREEIPAIPAPSSSPS